MAKNHASGLFDSLNAFGDIFGSDGNSLEASVVNIEVYKIQPFRRHPFHVEDDEDMELLTDSIRENGVMTPVLVRDLGDDVYEMISGHRRLFAAKKAGQETIPAKVMTLTDEEAVIMMVDTNIQREHTLPSEKAFAYKMRTEAVISKRKREQEEEGAMQALGDTESASSDGYTRSREVVAAQVKYSDRTVQRYISLTLLLPRFLDLIDKKVLPMSWGIEASSLSGEIQQAVSDYMDEKNDVNAVPQQMLAALKKAVQKKETPLTRQQVMQILGGKPPKPKKAPSLALPGNRIEQYFPPEYTKKQRVDLVVELLRRWREEQGSAEGPASEEEPASEEDLVETEEE